MTNEIQRDPLDGWVILLDGGCHAILGKPAGDEAAYGGRPNTRLEPVYHLEGTMNLVGDRARPGHVDVQRPIRVTPILGLVSLRGIPWPMNHEPVFVRDLSPAERAKILQAVSICEEITAKVRLDDAGIRIAPASALGGRQ